MLSGQRKDGKEMQHLILSNKYYAPKVTSSFNFQSFHVKTIFAPFFDHQYTVFVTFSVDKTLLSTSDKLATLSRNCWRRGLINSGTSS